MNYEEVTMVRIYLTEGERQLNSLVKQLRDWEKIRGVTVFRGVAGYGDSGVIHGVGIMDLSLDLPIVIEFYDVPDKVEAIIEHLDASIKPGHMVTWTAKINK
jgi:PII-like signaling protein